VTGTGEIMWEKLLVKVLPKIWKLVFFKLEQKDLMTKALEICWRDERMRKTWSPFVWAIQNWLRDAIHECDECKKWEQERK